MQRLQKCLDKSTKLLVPYITAGHPNPEMTVPLLHQLVADGADMLELGIPFSEPMAEGPVIQRAMEEALKFDISINDILKMVKEFRQQDNTTPIILMGYLNPVEVYGVEKFASDMAAAGVDALITVDLPPEEAVPLVSALDKHSIAPIFLVAPTTTEHRIQHLLELARGYLYYVSLKGVTGAGHLDTDTVATNVNKLKASTDLPVLVGFGIRDGETAAAVCSYADGAIVGSALIDRLAQHADNKQQAFQAASELMQSIRHAIDKD